MQKKMKGLFVFDYLSFLCSKFITCFVNTFLDRWLYSTIHFHLLTSCLSGVLPIAAVTVCHPLSEHTPRPSGSDPSHGPRLQPSTQSPQSSRDGAQPCTYQGQRSKRPNQTARTFTHSTYGVHTAT